jgi:hypothetical protein
MKVNLFASMLVVLIAGLCASPLLAAELKFKGGIGVIPVSNVTSTTVSPNTVRGINPPGQIWTISDLDARIKSNGDIKVDGKGLILAGGNNIGGAPAATSVFATLICETAAPFIAHSTNPTGVPLAANGDFKIDDVLDPPPPADCASPVLLIRTAGSGNWFAAGIPASSGKGN